MKAYLAGGLTVIAAAAAWGAIDQYLFRRQCRRLRGGDQ